MILEVEDVYTSYGLSQILFGVSLNVDEGECVALLGRNGVGKTTTLRSIMGLTGPKQGTVRYKGDDITGKAAFRVAKLGLGFVPEERRIFPDLTVRENLDVGRKPAVVPNGYIAVAGVVLTALAGSPEWFIAGFFLSGVGTAVSGPGSVAFVADIAPPELRCSAMGLYRMWGDLGIVLAPVLLGALADVTSISIAMLTIAAATFAAISWFQLVATEPPRAR